MSKVFGRIWIFPSFLILLVIASFFIAFNEEVFSQFTKILSYQNLFQASLISSQQILENNQEAFNAAQNKLPDFQFIEVKNGEVVISEESLEDKLDEIAEKIDIIARQVADLTTNPNDQIPMTNQTLNPNDQNEKNDENEKDENKDEKIQLAKQNTKTGGAKINYPKILISEVKISDFVKLYNPNSEKISLTNWYLQRKTATGNSYTSFATKNDFLGKTIGSNDYFLIGKQGRHTGSADMFVDEPITENNTFAFKNPNEEISDTYYVESPPAVPEPPPPPSLENILITEIQIAGLSGVKDEFVELYNPNDTKVDLTGFALKKKTSGGKEDVLVSSAKFSGKIIGSNDYFLIVPQDDEGVVNYTGEATPDLRYSNKSESMADNNTVLFYGKNGILQDKVGFGLAGDFEEAPMICPGENKCPSAGKSIKRKWDEATGIFQDTDNNFADFEISDTPTPRRE